MKSETTYDLGNKVYCDFCGVDWTDKKECGGMLFQSKAACPDCTPRIKKSAIKYNEERFIRKQCPEDMAFSDWVRNELRSGESGKIKVIEFQLTGERQKGEQDNDGR